MGGTVTVLDVESHAKVKTINFAISGVSADKIQPVGIIVGNFSLSTGTFIINWLRDTKIDKNNFRRTNPR